METSLSMRQIYGIIDRLKAQSHHDSTRKMYHIVWKKFNQFYLKLDKKPKFWEDHLLLFKAYLVDKKYKSKTIRSYVSAIKCLLSEVNVKLNEDVSLITSLTRACRLISDRVTTRLPIHKGLLQLILNKIEQHYSANGQVYLLILYRAMMSTAYYGLFRVGEITKGPHVILARNVHIATNKNKLLFILESSKMHNKGDKLQLVKISSVPDQSEPKQKCHQSANSHIYYTCPFEILKRYLAIRPQQKLTDEQFFIFTDGSAVLPAHLRAVLRLMFTHLNLNPALYGMHSIRIDRSSDLLKYGMSVETIKKVGRWKSNAIFRYLCD